MRAGPQIAAAATMLAIVACAGPARALPEATWVVSIGNNTGDVGDVRLLYAERDAQELSDVLRRDGNVASERIRVLLDEDATAVRRAILEASSQVRAHVGGASAPAALVVFYSGHGDAESLHLRGTRLPLDELRALVQSSSASLRLLFVDACRSGTVTRVKGVTPAAEFAIKLDDRAESEGVAILSSSAADETSQEADRLRASFFSHHLVNALRGAADRDGDGRVTLGEAYAYTYLQTLRSSGQTLALQHPTYSYDVKGRGDVVLTTPGAQGRRSGRLRLGRAATYVITESREDGPVVAEVTPARDRALLALPEGRYFVQRREPNEYREYSVELVPDREIDLAAVPSHAVRYDQLVRKRGGARQSVHGITLMVSGQGQVLAGEAPLAGVVLGYSADLPWLTIGARLRTSTAGLDAVDGGLPSHHYELGLALVLQRYVDLRYLSVAFGVSIEGLYHAQRFDAVGRTAPSRDVAGAGFGALFSLERVLWRGVALRVEGGPMALLQPEAVLKNGAEAGSTLGSTFTWWAAAGAVWRL